MDKLKCIIVDDEKSSRDGLRDLIEEDEDIKLEEVCSGGIEAIEAINEIKPDLVLLDIQMPDLNGFEVLENITCNPQIIFITAHDKYAIKAFEINAIDYLLKPFTNQRFYEAINRSKKIIRTAGENKKDIKNLAKSYLQSDNTGSTTFYNKNKLGNRLVVKTDGKVHFVDTTRIIWIEAYDYYIKIHVADHFFLVRESMKSIAQKLPADQFMRIHKSYIINLEYIDSISTQDGQPVVILRNNRELKISRTYYSQLKDRLDL